jgi:restriction system-associated AAA family ATPase
MKLIKLYIERSKASGGMFDGVEVWFGRDVNETIDKALAPICLIGPNGSGKSQFLQLIAEVFQAAWHAHAPEQERISSNDEVLFELHYLIKPESENRSRHIKLLRTQKGRRIGIELYHDSEGPILPTDPEFGKYLPSLVVGYTSGDNETLSLPFLASRSGYADEVAIVARKRTDRIAPDNRLMLIDYGTNLEVLFANLILGQKSAREEILRHARISDLASCRCRIRLAHAAAPKAPKELAKLTGRKGIQLTTELEATIDQLKKSATCWQEDPKSETYTFDFFVTDATREAFAHFWDDALQLYRNLHKFALLNDLAIPKVARDRLKKEIKERRFASRLPEPQQEDMVFGFEEVRFWPEDRAREAVDYVSLSDGEHQQALILGAYAMVTDANAIFLLDEPESHFNPQWRVKFVQRLMELTGGRGPQELLMTTHAPFVPSDMPREQVMIFSRCENKIEVQEPKIETFGAAFDRILETCFDVRPPNSKIAEEMIQHLLKSDDMEEVERGFNDLGPSTGKALIADHLRKMKSR